MYVISKIDTVGKVKKAEFQSGQKGVTFFSNWPGFADLKVGDQVDGDLTKSDYNGKEGWIMNQFKKQYQPKTATKSADVAKAQDRKAADVERAQERTSTSVQLSGSQRDAVLIVTTMFPELANDPNKEEMIRQKIGAWRNWFLDEFNNEQPPF